MQERINPGRIVSASYGKESIRSITWASTPHGEQVRDLEIAIRVSGDLLPSFVDGDNSGVVPSDSLRRHALSECESRPELAAESLMELICRRILLANPSLTAASARAVIRIWERQGDHSHLLMPMRGVAEAHVAGDTLTLLIGGVDEMTVLATTGSSFIGFHRDVMTAQPESIDRPLSGTVSARWTYIGPAEPDSVLVDGLRRTLVDAFTDRTSGAVQQLLTQVAARMLDAHLLLASIRIQFRALGLGALPTDLPGLGGNPAYEAESKSFGVTEVELAR